jgi:hypothetical protein
MHLVSPPLQIAAVPRAETATGADGLPGAFLASFELVPPCKPGEPAQESLVAIEVDEEVSTADIPDLAETTILPDAWGLAQCAMMFVPVLATEMAASVEVAPSVAVPVAASDSTERIDSAVLTASEKEGVIVLANVPASSLAKPATWSPEIPSPTLPDVVPAQVAVAETPKIAAPILRDVPLVTVDCGAAESKSPLEVTALAPSASDPTVFAQKPSVVLSQRSLGQAAVPVAASNASLGLSVRPAMAVTVVQASIPVSDQPAVGADLASAAIPVTADQVATEPDLPTNTLAATEPTKPEGLLTVTEPRLLALRAAAGISPAQHFLTSLDMTQRVVTHGGEVSPDVPNQSIDGRSVPPIPAPAVAEMQGPPDHGLTPSPPELTVPAQPDSPGFQVLGHVQALVSPTSQVTASPVTAQLPVLAAHVVEIASGRAGQVTEIALSPEELGGVRLSFRPHDSDPDRIVVMMTFDRPEAMELFRRHADQLLGDIRAAGFSGADLSFAQSDTRDQANNPHSSRYSADPLTDPPDPAATEGPLRMASASSLDLRL